MIGPVERETAVFNHGLIFFNHHTKEKGPKQSRAPVYDGWRIPQFHVSASIFNLY